MKVLGISDNYLLGHILRLPLKLIPPGIVIPVLRGRLRGKKWIVGSSNHGCWLGCYENKRELYLKKLSIMEA